MSNVNKDGQAMKCSTCARTTCPSNGDENRWCHGWIPKVATTTQANTQPN
jgi:hypothetical protein